jgi:hypothetical protein
VQLVAFRRPDLVAGLVLVDPADEENLADLPWPLRHAIHQERPEQVADAVIRVVEFIRTR